MWPMPAEDFRDQQLDDNFDYSIMRARRTGVSTALEKEL
jgi:hypothetical protein